MNILLDPNLAYLALVVGFILVIMALLSPGTGVLEIGALAAMVLAGYSVLKLPINIWALVVLLAGVIPFFLALRRSRQWIFLLLTIVALVVGSVFIFRQEDGSPAINPVLASVVSLLSVILLWYIGRRAIEAVVQPYTHDLNHLVGARGRALTDIEAEGTVYVMGENWSARSEAKIMQDTTVRVIGREGLVLLVEPDEKASAE
ncbi:MAG: hypothetical protein HPY45_05340 [Anaerolineae bacterium]|nr:hypothetical protein [Anaerolineae bacterium]